MKFKLHLFVTITPLLILLIGSTVYGALSNDGSIYGNVQDIGTGAAIANATVNSGNNTVSSDNKGNYSISLPPGVHDLTFSKTGYQTITVNNIVVSEGNAKEVNIYLTTPGILNITSTTLAPAETGIAYNQRVKINGGTYPYKYSIASGSLPSGLTINSTTGIISGTPTSNGSFTFSVGVRDAANVYAEREFSIEVTAPLQIISLSPLPRGTMGMNYFESIEVTGGTLPYTFKKMEQKYELNKTAVTWNTAKNLCESKGGHLITIGSYAENAIAVGLAQQAKQDVWIGFSDIDREGQWKWVTGESITYINWSSSNPDNCSGTQNCAQLWKSESYQWDDDYCSNNNYYICEYDFIPGMTFGEDGTLSGKPSGTGSYDFTVTVTDSSGRTAQKSFHLEIVPALTLSTTKLNNGIVGAAYNQTLAATGGYGTYRWEVFSGILPSGIQLNSSSGELSGTPSEATYGSIVLAVSDSEGRTTYKDFTIQTVLPFTILTTELPTALKESAFSEAIRTNGGVEPFKFSYTGQLPAGLSLNTSTGIISGTPTLAGYTNVSITVTDSTYPTTQSSTQNLGIRVSSSLTITTTSVLPKAKKGTAITSVILAAGGGASPYKWSVAGSGGSLPNGIVLNETNSELSGTPTLAGDYSFTIKVTDTAGSTAQKEFFMHVSGTLSIATGAVPDGGKGEYYAFGLEASGGLPPYQWRIKSGTLPTGLSFSTGTGTISGRPTTRQTYSFTVEVNDSDSPAQKAEKTYFIQILDELLIIAFLN